MPQPTCQASLDHVEVYVADLDQALPFWQPLLEALGYACECWGGATQRGLSAHPPGPGPYLCFVQAPEPHAAAGFHRQRPGLNHLAFRLNSPAEVDAIAAWAIAELGATACYHSPMDEDGWRLAFLEDPMRLKVELKAPLREAPLA